MYITTRANAFVRISVTWPLIKSNIWLIMSIKGDSIKYLPFNSLVTFQPLNITMHG